MANHFYLRLLEPLSPLHRLLHEQAVAFAHYRNVVDRAIAESEAELIAMTRRPQPIVFEWKPMSFPDTGEISMAMVPITRYQQTAAQQFDSALVHVLEQSNERNKASHDQYFAAINDHFVNLPEKYDGLFNNVTHFRKYLLVLAGICKTMIFPISEIKGRNIRVSDDYSEITVEGDCVIVKTALSQDRRSMNRQEFEDSKRKVLELAESITGISPSVALKNAGQSA
jgi:hypothetical protein